MAIIASSDFGGQGSNVSLTGKPLNNALGGTLTPAWYGSSPMSINASGQVIGAGSTSGNLVDLSNAGRMRWWYDPTGNPDNFALYALATGIIFGGNAIGMLIVGRTSMRIFRTTSGSRNDLQSLTIPIIDAPCYLELDQMVENTLTARIIELDGTTVRHSLTQPFITLPDGVGWGVSMFGSGSNGTFDNVVFEERPVLSTPVLTAPTGSAISSTRATGTVTTNVTTGTIFALDSAGTPDRVAILAGTQLKLTGGAGTMTVITSGLTPTATGIKRHYLHKRVTGEESVILRSDPFNMPATLPAPNTSVVTTIGTSGGRLAVIVSGVATNTDSLSASLPADTTPNGAVSQIPLLDTPDGGGAWSVAFEAPPEGNYAAAALLLNNVDFSNVTKSGTKKVQILPINLSVPSAEPNIVGSAPVFSSQLQSQSISEGQDLELTWAAYGTQPITFRLYMRANSGAAWDAGTVVTSPRTISGLTVANSGRQYRVDAQNSEDTTVGDMATMTVTAAAGATLSPPRLTNTGAMYAPVVAGAAGGPATLSPPRLANTGVLHAPTVVATAPGAVGLFPPRLANAAIIYAATVASAAPPSPGGPMRAAPGRYFALRRRAS